MTSGQKVATVSCQLEQTNPRDNWKWPFARDYIILLHNQWMWQERIAKISNSNCKLQLAFAYNSPIQHNGRSQVCTLRELGTSWGASCGRPSACLLESECFVLRCAVCVAVGCSRTWKEFCIALGPVESPSRGTVRGPRRTLARASLSGREFPAQRSRNLNQLHWAG